MQVPTIFGCILFNIQNSFFYCILDNYIDGTEFLSLTETDMKSLVPPIGLAKKILRLIPEKVNS